MKVFTPTNHLKIAYSTRDEGSFRDAKTTKHFLSSTYSYHQVFLLLDHCDEVKIIESDEDQQVHADAVITKLPSLMLTMVVGDCYPIVIFDQKNKVLAFIHGGWRSLAQNIITLTIQKMQILFRTQSEDLVAWIGPGISSAGNTQLDSPIQNNFLKWKPFISKNSAGEYALDLHAFISDQLSYNMVQSEHIVSDHECTYVQKDQFFSHRRATKENDEDGRFIVTTWIEDN